MQNPDNMSPEQFQIFTMEARLYFLEARSRAFQTLVLQALRERGLSAAEGVPLQTYLQQKTDENLQETFRALADHSADHANKLAAFWTELKQAAQKGQP
jgi:DNA-binding transcriptional regulator YbjK